MNAKKESEKNAIDTFVREMNAYAKSQGLRGFHVDRGSRRIMPHDARAKKMTLTLYLDALRVETRKRIDSFANSPLAQDRPVTLH